MYESGLRSTLWCLAQCQGRSRPNDRAKRDRMEGGRLQMYLSRLCSTFFSLKGGNTVASICSYLGYACGSVHWLVGGGVETES
jgi:hypothetical protein